MDRQGAQALLDLEPIATSELSKVQRELILRVLSGQDENGEPAGLMTADPQTQGYFDYTVGASGSYTVPEGARVVGISARAPASGPATAKIGGGPTINIDAGMLWRQNPVGRIEPGIVLVFGSTVRYFVELVVDEPPDW